MNSRKDEAMTITEFLLARIAEDEAECKPMAALDDDDRGGWAIHYAERVLAECAAKRAIVDHAEDLRTSHAEEVRAVGDESGRIVGKEGWLYPYDASPILAALAAVHKDHPDYQQEWAADA